MELEPAQFFAIHFQTMCIWYNFTLILDISYFLGNKASLGGFIYCLVEAVVWCCRSIVVASEAAGSFFSLYAHTHKKKESSRTLSPSSSSSLALPLPLPPPLPPSLVLWFALDWWCCCYSSQPTMAEFCYKYPKNYETFLPSEHSKSIDQYVSQALRRWCTVPHRFKRTTTLFA